jgi:hypothetical protein
MADEQDDTAAQDRPGGKYTTEEHRQAQIGGLTDREADTAGIDKTKELSGSESTEKLDAGTEAAHAASDDPADA